jgi:hypothetical protein
LALPELINILELIKFPLLAVSLAVSFGSFSKEARFSCLFELT